MGRNRRGGAPSRRDRQLRARFVLPPGASWLRQQEEPHREIVQAELLQWLDAQRAGGGDDDDSDSDARRRRRLRFGEGTSVVCSLPDVSEFSPPVSAAEYRSWFGRVADALFEGLSPGQCAIFYQSDQRVWAPPAKGSGERKPTRCVEWLDKAGLAADAAKRAGATLMWHKIVTFDGAGAEEVAEVEHAAEEGGAEEGEGEDRAPRPPARVQKRQMSVGRPQYSHLTCFSAGPEAGDEARGGGGGALSSGGGYDPKASLSPDVFDRGPQLWNRGAGIVAAHVALHFLATHRPVAVHTREAAAAASGSSSSSPPPPPPPLSPSGSSCSLPTATKVPTSQQGVRRVLNPCCGVGTFVAMANALGLDAVGVEESASRCADARALRLSRAAVEAYRVETGTLPPSAAVTAITAPA